MCVRDNREGEGEKVVPVGMRREENSEELGYETQLKVYSMHFSFCPDVCVWRGRACTHVPLHTYSSWCVCLCACVHVDDCTHTSRGDQRAVL